MTVNDLIGDVSLEPVSSQLEAIWALEGMSLTQMREDIEENLESMSIMPLFEIEEDSEDIEVLADELETLDTQKGKSSEKGGDFRGQGSQGWFGLSGFLARY